MRTPTLLGAAALLVAVAASVGCGDPCAPQSGPAEAPLDASSEVLWLETRGVAGAETEAVAKAVAAVPGVRAFSWVDGGARVVRERGTAADEALLAAAKAAGADEASRVPVATASFTFDKPLHCAGCVKQVEEVVGALAGVRSVDVPASKTSVLVVYDPRKSSPADVESALAAVKKPAKAAPPPRP
jgi:copper chaperone CopZ